MMRRVAPEVRELRSDEEWVKFARLSIDTFGGDEPAEVRAERWRLGFDTPSLGLVVVDGSDVVGAVCATPVEHFFGGRPVRAGAPIAGCLLPEYRRARVGAALMQGLIHRMRDAGLAVSCGWPSTVSVYRRLGWEVIGREVTRGVDARLLLGLTAPGELERDPLVNRRAEAIALQQRCAATWNGPFLRNEAWWDSHHPSRVPTGHQRYGWVEDGVLTGLVIAQRQPQRRLRVSDLWTATPNALLGLLGFLGAQETVIDRVEFGPGAQAPNDEISGVLTRPQMTYEAGLPWMLRFVDLQAALADRGYPRTLSTRLELEVLDRPDGDPTRLVLEVADGRASVTPGGRGALRVEQRALTSWYAGAFAMSRAVNLGMVHGAPDDIETLGLLAGDRSPWLPEHF